MSSPETPLPLFPRFPGSLALSPISASARCSRTCRYGIRKRERSLIAQERSSRCAAGNRPVHVLFEPYVARQVSHGQAFSGTGETNHRFTQWLRFLLSRETPHTASHTPPLQLDRNSFSGTLDSLIGLDALTQVIVSHNQLTGTFPMDTIGAGNQNALLEVLECASNGFSGDLPDQVRQPSSPSYLRLFCFGVFRSCLYEVFVWGK